VNVVIGIKIAAMAFASSVTNAAAAQVLCTSRQVMDPKK
jgi:hypothetical protein